MTISEFDVSIVICTHRRFDLLAGAVQSLVDQTAPPGSYEVIVVDNDHQPNTVIQEIVSNAGKQIIIKYLHESKLALSHARNTGGKAARAEYIGFMDDDAKAGPKYIEILLKDLHECTPDICGGPYYPFYLDAKPVWFLDRYGSGSHGDKPRYLAFREYLSGMNIVFRRNLLDEVGWFDPNLGMAGKKIWYGEETIIQIRARKINPKLKVYYNPMLYVLHLVPASKLSVWWTVKEAFLKGYSQAYFWISEPDINKVRIRAFCRLAKLSLYLLFRTFPGIIVRDRKNYPFWQNFVVEVVSGFIQRFGVYLRLVRDFLPSL